MREMGKKVLFFKKSHMLRILFVMLFGILNFSLYAQIGATFMIEHEAWELCHEGKYDESIKILDALINIDPVRYDLYISTSVIKCLAGRYEEGLEDINKVLELCPYSFKAFFFRSIIYCYFGEYEKALEDINQVIGMGSKRPEMYNQRGYIYLLTGDYKKACDDFDEAVFNAQYAREGFCELFVNRAYAEMLVNNFDAAEVAVEKAIYLESHSPKGYLAKLFLLKKTSKEEQLDEALENTKILFPDDKDILIFSLMWNIEKGSGAKIDADISKLTELDCHKEPYHELLKIYYKNIKDTQKFDEQVKILSNTEIFEDTFYFRLYECVSPWDLFNITGSEN